MSLSYKQLATIVASYVATNKIAQDAPFKPTVDNIAGLVDKISKTVTLDGIYEDKLPFMDGEDLPLGKTIEEFFEDLVTPTDFDSTGADTLAPSDPTYRPACYSYTLGRKKFKTTQRYDNLERACLNEQDYALMVTKITKKLWDSFFAFKYNAKRELLSNYANAAIAESTTTTVFSANSAYTVNTILKATSTATVTAIVVKAIPASSGVTYAARVADGFIVELDLVSTLAMPADTATGEAFIKQVKKDVEIANDLSEGHSLNGNALGVAEAGCVLFIKQGIMPSVDVDVLAGAFHQDNVALPAPIHIIKDFGTNANGVYAMLIDFRGARLHNGYRAVRTQENGDGDFLNYVLHTENTAFYSKNTFIKVYKAS